MSKKHKPTILVVDDQPINIKLLQRKLERQGMDVLVAYNGRECLDIVAETTPDLILLDVM
ncbi:MAG: response regulator, partial [Alphaproteobacteria bacterium]